jgi:iron complex outermembrane receptor protein
MPELVARATSSQGFRTPNIPESMGKVGLTGFFNGTLDPRRCDTAIAIRDILKTGNSTDASDASSAYNSGCSVSLPAMISANADIKPEVSNSATLGLVFQPSKEVSISVDYFLIERTNEINYRTPSYVLARELTDPTYAALVVRNTVTAQDKYWADRANQLKPGANISWGAGSLLSMVLQYENYAKTQVSGLDIDARGRWSAGELGSFNLGVQATINQTYLVWDVASAQYRPNFIGTYGQPRVVGLLSGSWTQGPWTTGLWVNYTSSTGLNGSELDLGTWSESACAARLKAGDLPCYIKADYVTNVSLTYKGFKGLTLSGYITNLDESQAPVDLKGGTGPRPRSFKVAANYTF